MRLRLYESVIAFRFVFSRRIRGPATFDFCNKIPRTADIRQLQIALRVEGNRAGVIMGGRRQTPSEPCNACGFRCRFANALRQPKRVIDRRLHFRPRRRTAIGAEHSRRLRAIIWLLRAILRYRFSGSASFGHWPVPYAG